MFHAFKKINKIVEKNKLEGLALISGKMPKFVYGRKNFNDVPVFCFHSAQFPLFEKQLQFLNENGYKTLTADELYERSIDKRYENNGKEIAITFDDGMASVWTVAYPLLEKYEHKIISFILPGLMKQGEGVGAKIDDVVSVEEKIDLSNRDYNDEPLCNWNEVEIMHASGLVDFQSHGMNHALINTSAKIVDFIHPEYDAYHYGNIHIPIYHDMDAHDTREKVLGHPVYQHAPRLSAKARYFDPVELRQLCAAFVAERGGEQFFQQSDWRHKLEKITVDYQADSSYKCSNYESLEQTQAAMFAELLISKHSIEQKLKKNVTHFCYPWFVSSLMSVTMANECGYQNIHLGALSGFRAYRSKVLPIVINRIQEEYLLALPGVGKMSLFEVFQNKIKK